MTYHPSIHRCEHIKVNGTQCGSPAIRKNSFCYFHGRWREQHILLNTPGVRVRPAIDLPVLEDANSIQCAIMQVMSLLLTGQIEHKTAALLLYGLQTASGNLRHTRFEEFPREVVIDPDTVDQTLLGENVWENSDFDDEQDEEEDEDEENDSAENDGVPALAEQSEPKENDWGELRTQIATIVKQAAVQGRWDEKFAGEG